jgi:hypothetical protein
VEETGKIEPRYRYSIDGIMPDTARSKWKYTDKRKLYATFYDLHIYTR